MQAELRCLRPDSNPGGHSESPPLVKEFTPPTAEMILVSSVLVIKSELLMNYEMLYSSETK